MFAGRCCMMSTWAKVFDVVPQSSGGTLFVPIKWLDECCVCFFVTGTVYWYDMIYLSKKKMQIKIRNGKQLSQLKLFSWIMEWTYLQFIYNIKRKKKTVYQELKIWFFIYKMVQILSKDLQNIDYTILKWWLTWTI